MRLIYSPSGPASEYAPQALTVWFGCTNGCQYCYCPGILRMTPTEYHAESRPRPGFLAALRKDAPKHAGNGTILLSFASDPYPARTTANYTRPAIAILRDAGCSITMLTKRPTAATADFAHYDRTRSSFATSITIPINQQHLEPHTDPYPARLEALATANAAGIPTWASIEPVLFPDFILSILPRLDFCRFVRIGAPSGRTAHLTQQPTDWRTFALRAVDICRKAKLPYYLKTSLTKHLTPEDIAGLEDMIPPGNISLELLNNPKGA